MARSVVMSRSSSSGSGILRATSCMSSSGCRWRAVGAGIPRSHGRVQLFSSLNTISSSLVQGFLEACRFEREQLLFRYRECVLVIGAG